MKRIFPQNYVIMLLCIGAMYGLLGFIILTGTHDYFAIPILIGCAIFMLNRRISLDRNSIIIIQGFMMTKIRYDDIRSVSIKKHKPKFSRFPVPAISIIKKNGEKKILYHKMYSKKSITEVTNTLMNENSGISLADTITEFIRN